MGFVLWKERKNMSGTLVRYSGRNLSYCGTSRRSILSLPESGYIPYPENEFRKTVNDMIEMLDSADLVKKPTRQLSLGERMKCEFIMAMLHKPKIVFLDEPTIGLDVIAKGKIRDFILEQNKKGTTFILTTHDLEDVEQLGKACYCYKPRGNCL